jgi:hypothetical protein
VQREGEIAWWIANYQYEQWERSQAKQTRIDHKMLGDLHFCKSIFIIKWA